MYHCMIMFLLYADRHDLHVANIYRRDWIKRDTICRYNMIYDPFYAMGTFEVSMYVLISSLH